MLSLVLPTQLNFLDQLIGVLIALFILSVITEKIVSLIRKYPTQCQLLLALLSLYFCTVSFISFFDPGHRWYYFASALIFLFTFILSSSVLSVKFFNVSLREKEKGRNTLSKKINYFFHKGSTEVATINPFEHISDKSTSEDKSKEVTLLSFLTGVAVAFMFQTDMIEMLLSSKEWIRPWEEPLLIDGLHFNPDLAFTFRTFFGILMAGFFLSFGSKFFHDLIDNLMQAKDLKRKLNQKEDLQSIEEVEEFISYSESDVVILAIAQNESVLKNKFPNITFLDDSVSIINGQRTAVVAIYINDTNTTGIPDQLPVRLPSGRGTTVPTEIVTEFNMGTISGGMDGELANNDSPGYRGSGCCVMKGADDEVCLITNCHVMTEGDLENPQFDIDFSKEEVLYEQRNIGSWRYGKMDRQSDFAYIELDDPQSFMNENDVGFFNDYREIKKEDLLALKVTARGNVCKINNNAFIIDVVKNKIGIRYNFGLVITFDEVILVGDKPDKKTCRPVSDHGDSGGSVYDNDNNLIGMITGKNDRFSFILPLQKTASMLNLKLS